MTKRNGIWLIALASLCHADTLTLRNGNAVTGSWLSADAQQIRFLVNDQVRAFARGEVAQVDFGENTGPANVVKQTTPPAPAGAFEQIGDGIRFVAGKCERHDTREVVCKFTAEALTKDIQVSIGQGSFMVDSKGMKQNPQNKVIGSASYGIWGVPTTLLVQNVPVAGQLEFGGVDASVDRVELLSLDYSVGNNVWHTLTFRHLALQGN